MASQCLQFSLPNYRDWESRALTSTVICWCLDRPQKQEYQCVCRHTYGYFEADILDLKSKEKLPKNQIAIFLTSA